MSLHAIGTSIASTGILPQVTFGGSGHKKSGETNPGASGSSTIGQIPVGTGQNLLESALQSLEQAIGAQNGASTASTASTASGTAGTSAVGAATAASTATSAQSGASVTSASTTIAGATPAVALNLQGFLHSLFSALRADGAGADSSTTAAAVTATGNTASGTSATGSSASQYQGSLVSSLQTLIQQLSGGAPSSPATANLSSSFNSLVQGLSANTAVAGTGSAAKTATSSSGTTASTAQLTNFLNGLLQKIQGNGSQAPSLLGSHVNANV
jgi:hypothetical protein